MGNIVRFQRPMVIDLSSESILYTCDGSSCDLDMSETIPHYYSPKHASDEGWRFLPHDQVLCSVCAKAAEHQH